MICASVFCSVAEQAWLPCAHDQLSFRQLLCPLHSLLVYSFIQKTVSLELRANKAYRNVFYIDARAVAA